MFDHLDHLLTANPEGVLSSAAINTFSFQGRAIRLIVQAGIWKPAGLSAALTIRTTYTPPDQPPPYEDDLGPEGMVRYKYRGTDPNHSDNRALRQAMDQGLPLAYFVGVAKGIYVPDYPVWIVDEDPSRHQFAVAVDEGQRYLDLGSLSAPQRDYVERLTRSRLHQPVFRARVLLAYGERCAICRLHHAELLDAAHIIPDGEPNGDPVVPNGLALCKIHHAAYDANLLGVRSDLTVEVAQHLLEESDGPMLRHGLQEIAGTRLVIPRQRSAQPEPERLEYRYEQFRAAS
ncbi:MAG TPA: HNH endonuclease [Acidimicrobiales bacterium]|nr:HNH endonuclease [Acidimicrobiales bacterium]